MSDAANPLPQDIRRSRILALANQKGGVGKTTTAINLATALAAVGERVLIVDLDPQGNASTGLGVKRSERKVNSYHVLIGQAGMAEAVLPTKVPNLSIVPATMDLSGAEVDLIDASRRTHRLRDVLRDADLPYDRILIDCPPTLTFLTINAMVAADAVLVPLQCEFFALEGLGQLLKTVELVRTTLNPKLDIHGVVLTMFDSRNRLSGDVARDVRGHLGDKVYETVIPRNVRVSEAPSFGVPALIYDHRCPGSDAYIRLAGEVLRRERQAA